MQNIKTVGVVGSGQMGAGIAQVFAMAGFTVLMEDISSEYCEKGFLTIKNSLAKMLEKQKITKDVHDSSIKNISLVTDLQKLSPCDLVVEAIPENIHLKLETFKKLSEITRPEVILASNTSSISIAKIGSGTNRPDKVVGMHFMNPVPVMQCVEVIRSSSTSDATYETVMGLVKKIGKTAVTSKDSPGFIINRILMPMINEAIYTLHTGVATAEDIDLGMKLSCNFPMGPLALADLIGLDTVHAIINVLYTEFRDEKYRPCGLLSEYVEKGFLGRKTKKGFYTY